MRSAPDGARAEGAGPARPGQNQVDTADPADAAERAARPTPAFSHLAACPACGSLNGHSAASCWNCEASLSSVELSPLLPALGVAEPAPVADTERVPLTRPDHPTEAAVLPDLDDMHDKSWGTDDEATVRADATPGFEHPAEPDADRWAAAAARLPNATDPPYPVLTRWIDRQAPDFDHSREVPFEAPRDDAFAAREMQGLAPPAMVPDLLGMAPRTDFHDTVLMPAPRAARASPRPLIAVGSMAVLIGALGAAAYLYLRPTEGESAGARSTAPDSAPVVAAPAGVPDTRSAAPKASPDADRETPVPSPAAASAPVTASVPTPTPTPTPALVPPPIAPPAKPVTAPLPATPRATGAVPPPPASPNPAPATRRSPAAVANVECTPTVAALGLCTLPPAAPSKE